MINGDKAMIWIVLGSVFGTIAFVLLIGFGCWWALGNCGKEYDAGCGERIPEFYRNPETGRLVIPLDEVVWSEDGT